MGEGKVEISDWRNRGYLVSSGGDGPRGLMIHGYGGNSEEMMGLAVSLAGSLNLRILVFDLPGHGRASGDLLSLAAAKRSLGEAADFMDEPSFFVGHSLGARLGLLRGLDTAVLVSMPGEASFAGSRAEMLRTLRARRVKEAAPLSGLEEIMSEGVSPAERTMMLYARRDIESVIEQATGWKKKGVRCLRVDDSSHNDIINSRRAAEAIAGWLTECL